MYRARYAIMIDGGFMTKKLYRRNGRHASADDVVAECDRLRALPDVSDYELLRIYYYDAPPSDERVKMPVSGNPYDLAGTVRFRESQSLYDQLVQRPNLALRMGETRLLPENWTLKPRVQREIIKKPRPLQDDDFALAIGQKGVDMRIGMDMARLALRDMVRAIIAVTGDSDFIPAFKFVRREGVKVILEPLGSRGIRVDLTAHADIVVGQDSTTP